MRVSQGDTQKAMEEADVVVEGEMNVGGQEHFYLEPNAVIATPQEDNGMFLLCSTQNPTKTQVN